MQLTFDTLPTNIGELVLVYERESLVFADFASNEARRAQQLARRFGEVALAPRARPDALLTQLARYFAGDVGALDDVEDGLLSPGGTELQRRVWRALREIRPGETLSYGELATRVGLPRGARAVGAINGQNPLAIIVPCHRVIGANGSLTGYAGGIERKRWLLAHEASSRALASQPFSAAMSPSTVRSWPLGSTLV